MLSKWKAMQGDWQMRFMVEFLAPISCLFVCFVLFCFVCFVLFCWVCLVLFGFVWFGLLCLVWFGFVLLCFVLFCFVCFVLFCLVWFALFGLVWVCLVLFGLFCFVLFVCLFVFVQDRKTDVRQCGEQLLLLNQRWTMVETRTSKNSRKQEEVRSAHDTVNVWTLTIETATANTVARRTL